MSIESIAAILFLIILTLFLIKNRNKLEIQKIIWPAFYFFNKRKVDALIYEGIELAKKGKQKEAEACFDEALRIKLKNPKSIDNLTYKGITLYHLGKHKEAIKCFDRIINSKLKHPESSDALIYKGIALGKLGQYDEAIACFNKALKIGINIPILYFALYKTKIGLKQMNSLAKKHSGLINIVSKIGVYLGVIGMALIVYLLVKNLVDLFLVPSTVSGVALVLPFKVKGGFYVPFFYWIISIFVIATIHEFCHGVVARIHNVPIKSSGFAFLGLIVPVVPAAFVEPNEKVLSKKKRMQKLSVFAAGPFSNLLSGLIFLVLFILLSYPVTSYLIEFDGVKVEGYTNSSNSELAGLPKDSLITDINGMKILTTTNLSDSLAGKKPGEEVNVSTANKTYAVKLGKNPDNSSLPYLGVLISQHQKTKESFEDKYGSYLPKTALWIMGLLYWLYLLSIGIGLFNLVPVGPVDGGLMSRELLGSIFKKKETALKAWYWTSLFFLTVIIMNLLAGFF